MRYFQLAILGNSVFTEVIPFLRKSKHLNIPAAGTGVIIGKVWAATLSPQQHLVGSL